MIETKVCGICKEEKPLDELVTRGTSKKTGEKLKKNLCKKCANKQRELARKANLTPARIEANKRRYDRWKENHPDAKKEKWLMDKYGLDIEQYNKLSEEQNNKCFICNSEEKLHVDHCHKTGKVRGLLCNGCNTAIGLLHEDISIMQRATEYVKFHLLNQ